MKLRRSALLYHFVRLLGVVAFQALCRLEVQGRENIPFPGPGILLPKHQFWTDIPVVGLAAGRPLHYVAKQELFIHPGVKHFLTLMGGVPIDRLQPVRSLESFRYLERLLRKGEYLVLFPEGTYFPGSMGPGKHRYIQRLLKFQETMPSPRIPFIPVGIQYLEKRLRPGIQVRIGRPLFAERESEGRDFTRRILDEIAGLSGIKA